MVQLSNSMNNAIKISSSSSNSEDSEADEKDGDDCETKFEKTTRRASQRLIKAHRIQREVQEASDEENELEEAGLNLEKVLSRRGSGNVIYNSAYTFKKRI